MKEKKKTYEIKKNCVIIIKIFFYKGSETYAYSN